MVIQSRFFDDFKNDLPKVNGKIFVITGTTTGTGFVAARTVAEKGGEAVLLNRPSSRVTDMMAKLKEAVPDGKFITIECDLQDFSSVKKAAEEVKARYESSGGIYCLANNAGIMATPDKATVDGFDTQMQTNHLSHFLLTSELYPLLKAYADANGDARVVNHSSLGRLHTVNGGLEKKYFEKNGGNLGGDELKMMGGACFHRYFQTKLANSVFTYGLHNKLNEVENNKVRSIAAHPGGSETELGTHMKLGWFWEKVFPMVSPYMMQSPEDGAAGLLKCMMDPQAESGKLYGPANSAMKGRPVENPPKNFETDPEAIEMLWKTSEEATGVKFEI